MSVIRYYLQLNSWTHYLCAGTLLGLAFVHPLLWVLCIPGIVIWCYAVTRAQTLRQASLEGWLMGSAMFLLVLSWYWAVYPLDWLAIDSTTVSLAIIGLYWILTSVVLGLGILLSSTVLWFLFRMTSRKWLILVLAPAVMVAGYICGSFLFSIYILGPGSGLNTAFSFGYPGYLLMEHGVLRYGGVFGGVYTLSYIVLGFGVLLHSTISSRFGKYATGIVLGCMCVMVGTSLFQIPPSSIPDATTVRVVAVGSSVPLTKSTSPEQQERQQAQLWEAVRRANAYDPDYIVLPEGASLTREEASDGVFQKFSEFGLTDLVLVDSRNAITSNGGIVSRTLAFDIDRQAMYSFDKQYLVPQGEYVPYVYGFLFWVFGQNDFFSARTARMQYEQGGSNLVTVPDYMPGILSCFEVVKPTSVADIVREQPVPFIAHSISHSWFNNPYVLWYQLDQMVSLQAVSNSVSIVQAGNEGPTMARDRWGYALTPTSMEAVSGHEVYVFNIAY